MMRLRRIKMMLPFEKCPVCGGELKDKVVEKILHGGNHTAILQIRAEVCLHCGERLYAEETVRLFEKIRNKLRARAKITSHFYIPSSGHLWPRLNRKILEIAQLFLWFCSIGVTKSDPNPGTNSVNLFLREL
jgi:YgiT-type zinc finger domain-containing protein